MALGIYTGQRGFPGLDLGEGTFPLKSGRHSDETWKSRDLHVVGAMIK
jgi:hypothetical protein